jgi:tRNA-Thr(GGU) m(6)t(6)A37 methyltransferase TsaA
MEEPIEMTPIGVVRTPFRARAEAPRQPRAAAEARGVIELFEGRGFEDALCDVSRWRYLWLVFVFHENLGLGFRPKVLPPRSDVKRGVFATRSPHRPNPIGISVVRLERVDGLRLHVRELDLLDGTPLLDIKPYVAWADAIPDAGGGWLEEEEDGSAGERRPPDPCTAWRISFTDDARAQLEFLASRNVHLSRRVEDALALGPQPHAYRRIRREPDGRHRVALGEWRAWFVVDAREISVCEISTGYRPRELHLSRKDDPALDPHRAFVDAWGYPPTP